MDFRGIHFLIRFYKNINILINCYDFIVLQITCKKNHKNDEIEIPYSNYDMATSEMRYSEVRKCEKSKMYDYEKYKYSNFFFISACAKQKPRVFLRSTQNIR